MKSRPLGIQPILATDHNTRRDDARGGSFLLAHQQLGAFAMPTNPTNGQTLTVTINGTAIVIAFVTAIGSTPNNVLIQGTAALTAAATVNFLRRPDQTNANQVAATVGNQALIQYLGYSLPSGATTITPFSLNKNVNGATGNFTSFTASTTVTGASWTAQTMKLYVEDGTYYINGTRYLFTGGSTPAVTGPISNPRIDVLTIDTSGTLAWTTGTENASPVAPTYPSDKFPICELYNIVSESALYDLEDQQAGQGYILNDVRPSMSIGPILTAIASDLDPDVTDSRQIGSSSGNEWLNIYVKNLFAASTIQLNGANVAFAKFGGTGADGALSISSGTTTINLGGASAVTKNYTSISITGTGNLAFSNPAAGGTIVTLKSQGNVTITTSSTHAIDLRGIGASPGNNPTAALQPLATSTQYFGSGSGTVNGGAQYLFSQLYYAVGYSQIYPKQTILISPGAPGGTQGSAIGGIGGGALYLECAGALNFTTGAIDASGGVGGSTTSSGGAAGGGAAGMVVILYNILTANTGTINTAGGPGGNTTTGSSTSNGGGGGGSLYGLGGHGGTGNANGQAGQGSSAGGGGAGTSLSNSATGGVGGASAGGIVAQNTDFV